MRARLIISLVAVLALAACALAEGPSLYPGSGAPKIDVKRFIKGSPMTELPAHGVAVVEFWATWCGPCKMSIPHLTEVAHKHKDVKFIGVSIWEDDGPALDKFVTGMGDKMDYLVAYSSNQDGMAKTWMAASGSNGIPTAFIVKDRVVQWIGHPMELEGPLDDVLAGKNDVAKVKAAYLKAAEAIFEQQEQSKALQKIDAEFWAGQEGDAKKELAAFKAAHKEHAYADALEMAWMAKTDEAGFLARVGNLLKSAGDEKYNAYQAVMSAAEHKGSEPAAAKGAKLMMDEGGDDINCYFVAYSVYSKLQDKANSKLAAQKVLDIADKKKIDIGDMKATLEAVVKG